MKANSTPAVVQRLAAVSFGLIMPMFATSLGAESYLVKDGQPRAEIIIAEQPQRSTQLAAADLRTYVEKISGARLPMATEPSEDVPVQRLFWATANFVVDGQESQDWWDEARRSRRFNGMGGSDRRLLMLLYSVDALNWFQAGCVV